MLLRGALVVALLVAGGLLGSAAEDRRATPRPPAGAPAVLGGFTALAAQAVWIRADRAVLRHEEDRAVTHLRTLVDLQPEVVSAARYAAWEIGVNMMQGHEDPATRASLAREAVRILGDCVARNPVSSAARVHRARYLYLFVAREDALAEDYRRRHGGVAPFDAAFDEFARALELDPGSSDAASGLASLGTLLGVDAAAAERWAEAADRLVAAVRGYDLTLADAEATLGEGVRGEGADAERFREATAARDAAAALLEVARAPEAERADRLTAFRAAHPGVLDPR